MTKSTRFTIILLFVTTIVLAVIAVYVGTQLEDPQRPVIPDPGSAASQEVWDAEIFSKVNLSNYYPETKNAKEAITKWAGEWKKMEDQKAKFEDALDFALGKGGRFVQDQLVLTVGEEKLYGRDLNYFLFIYQYDVFTAPRELTDAELNKAVDRMIEQSLVLQVSRKEGILPSLSADIFNSVNKDIKKRNELVNANLVEVKKKLVQNVSFEMVKIFYDNVMVEGDKTVSSRSAKLTKEQAKAKAKKKMDEIYTKITTKNLTMLEAAEEIRKDKSLAEVDAVFYDNAYFGINNLAKEVNPFASVSGEDKKLYDELWALGEGQVSKVLESETDDAYVVIKVVKREGGLNTDSYDKFLDTTKGATEIKLQVTKGKN